MADTISTIPIAPSAPNTTTTPASRILAILGAVFGGFILLSSLCGIIAYLIVPLQRGRDVVLNNTLLASGVALGLIYGALILGLALSVLAQRAWPHFRLPPPLIFIAILLLAIGLGQAILSFNLAPAYLFPPWHVLASAMVPFAVLAYAARRLPPVSSPSVVGELTWGGVGTILLAIVFELIAGILLFVIVALVLVVLIGPAQLQQLGNQIRPLLQSQDNLDALVQLVMRQPTLLITVGLAAIAMFSVIVPLIEETLKALGPAIAIGVTKPTITRALMWGLASGAGYAFTENLLNGATALNGDVSGVSWAVPMTLRAGTSLVHIATTATISLGVYGALVQRRRAQFFLYLIAGLAAHGLWNLVSVVSGGVLTGLGQSGGASSNIVTNVLEGLIGLVLIAMLIAAGAWIIWLIHWAKRVETRQAEPANPKGLSDSSGLIAS